MRAAVRLSAFAMLAGCAVSGSLPVPAHMPEPAQQVRLFKVEMETAGQDAAQTHLLAVQPEADGWRFIQTDALGAPVSRQIAAPDGWRNDGFVMPNAAARRLFAAILPLVDDTVYADIGRKTEQGETVYSANRRELWRVRASSDGYRIRFPDKTSWHIEELPQDEPNE